MGAFSSVNVFCLALVTIKPYKSGCFFWGPSSQNDTRALVSIVAHDQGLHMTADYFALCLQSCVMPFRVMPQSRLGEPKAHQCRRLSPVSVV